MRLTQPTALFLASGRIGLHVADQLLTEGADEILAEVQRTQAAVEGIQP